MTTQDEDESYESFLHTANSGNVGAGEEDASRPRATTNTFDPALPAAATGAGGGAAFDPPGEVEDPEEIGSLDGVGINRAEAEAASPWLGDVRIRRKSDAYHRLKKSGEVATYSGDTYSFMAIHSPFVEPIFFLFGFMVFLSQIAFLMFMFLSLVVRKFRFGEIDNPDDGDDIVDLTTLLARFIPANVNWVANATQIIAILSYCIFADSSLMDMAKAVEQFPRGDRARPYDGIRRVRFSCVLRLIQGLLATIVTMLLIVTSADVVDIILNFTAVNYISNLDEVAFDLAKWGKYGPRLEKEAKSIETRAIPYCVYRKYKHQRHLYTVVPATLVMLVLLAIVFFFQVSDKLWTTKELRVQFRDPALHDYSGCYKVDSDISYDRRNNYNGKAGKFGYCIDEHHWVLFANVSDGKGGVITDPCKVPEENQLVISADTDTFDIWSSFDELWFTGNGEPLGLYFFDQEDEEDLNCDSFLYDGKCDAVFNTFEHRWDGGDCCAFTCSEDICGLNGVTRAFGEKGWKGNGYPDCKDPSMKAVTILLTGIKSSRYESLQDGSDKGVKKNELGSRVNFWNDEEPNSAYLMVDCVEVTGATGLIKKTNVLSVYVNQTLENHTETILVPDGASCEISVSNGTNFENEWNSEHIWYVNYTLYHGNTRLNKMLSGESSKERTIDFQRFPECYFDELKDFVDLESAYTTNTPNTKSLRWLIDDNDKSGHSQCGNPFLLERAALAALNFAAPNQGTKQTFGELWINSQQQCGWENILCDEGSVRSLLVKDFTLSGTISSAVGKLVGLERLEYDNNGLSGPIPSEIGLLTKINKLDIEGNLLTGTIPTEFGNLIKMVELDLDKNQLNGTIPSEFGRMSDLKELDIKNNQLSGTIPSEIGSLRNLKYIEADNNLMTGVLPITTLKNLTNLLLLELNNNTMTGPLPTQLGELTTLKKIYLGDNGFTGTIPTEIGLMESLTFISFRGNSFKGLIPSEIGLMTNLTEVWLDSNKLSGVIPVEVASLKNLIRLELTNNSMIGPLPTQLGELTKIEHLHLGDNGLNGTIPTEIGLMTSLSSINLRGNSLRGPIPSEIGLMTNLKELHLEGNYFTGTIPDEVTLLDRLQILTFGSSLTGSIPGNIKTLVPCVLCSGTSYKKWNIVYPYYNLGPGGATCAMLLEKHEDSEMLFSVDECEFLKEACIDCTVPDNLFAAYGSL